MGIIQWWSGDRSKGVMLSQPDGYSVGIFTIFVAQIWETAIFDEASVHCVPKSEIREEDIPAQ